ncbi:MAG TPA: adenylate/guanylate cyclase domain-containing protein [Vicinamibacterales bacterium]|nr:adenylate/guanylate cyclase domain-containing protein [Vicinamibacterales bacterium]
MAFAQPRTRYAKSGEVNIAFQVLGDAPRDLVFVMGWLSNLDEFWTEPSFARFLRRLASFSRLIMFDKRGTGLSDRVSDAALPTLEQRMDDVRAVMDAAGSQRAALLGVSEGGPMCALFAATYPERTTGLMMFGSYPVRCRTEDYPWGPTQEEHDQFIAVVRSQWGGPVGLEARMPSMAHDAHFRQWWTRYLTHSASPGAAATLLKMNAQIDVRHVLPVIRVPCLIMHRPGDRTFPVEGARYMAERIFGAKYVELSGDDHLPWIGEQDTVVDEIEEFLTGTRHGPEPDRVLATVMFTDIVGSTDRAAALGDRKWGELLDGYYALARRQLGRWRGSEIDTAGDGLFARFDGPARAVRCARAIADEAKSLGLEIRAGLHTGEVQVIGDKVGGIAVHIGARVASFAAPGRVLVSSTVKDLVAGSGIQFEDGGTHVLKGVPGEWRLFLATVA